MMLDAAEAAEKPPDFVEAENDRQLRRRLRGRDDLGERPLLLEGDPVEEAQGGDRNLYRTRRQLPFIRQVDLIGADFLGAQHGWRLHEISSEPRNLLDVGAL